MSIRLRERHCHFQRQGFAFDWPLLIPGSFALNPGSGLAGVFSHVDSLEMLVEQAPHNLLMPQVVPPESELHGGTRRAFPRKKLVVG